MRKSLKKHMVLLSILAALTASNEVSAQSGLFQRGDNDKTIHEQTGLLNGNRDEQAINGVISNQTFETPIGNGMFFLVAAGLSYVVLKKMETQS